MNCGSKGLSIIDRIFYPNTFFSAAHGTFAKMHSALGPKAYLTKYRKTDMIPCILADQNVIRLQIKSKRDERCKGLLPIPSTT